MLYYYFCGNIIENVLNRDEFDGDADAGVYNPVVLPWKNRGEKS